MKKNYFFMKKNTSHFRLNIRTEAVSVLLAENFGKMKIRKNDDYKIKRIQPKNKCNSKRR
jgi:hypothetical protein